MPEGIPGGYTGKILRVNLANRNISIDKPDAGFYRKHLGGAGFVFHFLWKELPPKTDALSPGNKLIFALGPVTGVPIPGSGRNCVGSKSPLTGGVAKSEAGEFWGAELKRAGFDAIIVDGKARNPVYLWVHDGEVEIKDAKLLWGKNTGDTQEAIRTELNDKLIRVALIGQAGENLVRIACIMHGLYDAAGRGGLGAVMGSKNLKAIAVRGHKAPEVANADGVKAIREWYMANQHLNRDFHEYGTGAAMAAFETIGNLPVRNFRDGLFPEVNKINAVTLKEKMGDGMDGCFACPIRCKKRTKSDGRYKVDPAYGGPEYETLASLGSDCGVTDLEAIAKGSELCNAYSLDSISTGSAIAFAMECFENGLLTVKDTGGIELKFGNAEAMLQMIEMIALRQGIGNILAEGTLRAAQKIGRGARKYAIHSKGLEAGMHEPRVKKALGLGFMVNPHGADHCCNVHDQVYAAVLQLKNFNSLGIINPPELNDIGPRKVSLFKIVQAKQLLCDSLVVCQFLPYSPDQLAELTAAVTGWNTGIMELLRISERNLTLARMFNLREGLTAADDALPERFYQPKTNGVLADKPLNKADMNKAKSYYYALMGWDRRTGVPTAEKLEDLEIG